MAQKVMAVIKLQLPAGQATPGQPVGPALGQHGVNIMQFVKEYNARTAGMTGEVVAAHVGLGLDEPGTQDAPAGPPAEHLPEERHGHGFGIAGIERALEDGARFGRRPAPCRHG